MLTKEEEPQREISSLIWRVIDGGFSEKKNENDEYLKDCDKTGI